MTDVVGIALAGVLAWRPNSLDAVIQRPFLPLANRPWIEHFILRLGVGGIRRLAISINRLSDALLALVRRVSADVEQFEVFVDGPPRGSAGCCRDVAEQMPAARYLIVESLVIPRLDIVALLDHHVRQGAVATVVVDAASASETGAPGLARPVGVHVVEREFLLSTAEIGYQDLKEVLINRAVRDGAAVSVYRSPAVIPRITDLSSYLDAQELVILDEGRPGVSPASGTAPSPPVSVHPSAEIGTGARITGPAIIGPDTVVHRTAAIIGACTIGANCSIGENAVVTESAVWDNCRLSNDVVLNECVLSSGTYVAPHARKERELLLGNVTS